MKPISSLLLNLLFMLILVFPGFAAKAQENEHVYLHGRRYLDLNIQSLSRYSRRVERCQRQMLRRLKRKEARLARRLRRTDSAAYASFKARDLSFDSISHLAVRPDSATFAAKSLRSGQKAVDSLKRICNFLQGKAARVTAITQGGAAGAASDLGGYESQLNRLQQQLDYQSYLSGLMNDQAASLEGIANGKAGITGIPKELFYAKAKIAEWQRLADDPSRLEEKALEYLQGTKGFEQSMSTGGSSSNRAAQASGASAEELEKMGYQTKRQVSAALQQKLGNYLSAAQSNLSKQLGAWQSEAGKVQGDLKESTQCLSALKHTNKPNFHVNPMRGKPFWMRFEKQYSFNTARAMTISDGTRRPAILTLAAGVAYKQSPSLSAGAGLATDIGLGENWNAIRFSFQGLEARIFLAWQWQYGLGLYGGYERTWKRFSFTAGAESAKSGFPASTHNTACWSESALLGVSKKYRINSRWNGAIQVLYDLWWEDKALRSPIVLRFINTQ